MAALAALDAATPCQSAAPLKSRGAGETPSFESLLQEEPQVPTVPATDAAAPTAASASVPPPAPSGVGARPEVELPAIRTFPKLSLAKPGVPGAEDAALPLDAAWDQAAALAPATATTPAAKTEPVEIATDAVSVPATPSPEAFLNWLDSLKALSARLPPQATTEGGGAAALLPGLAASREGIGKTMIDTLAAAVPEATSAPATTPGTPTAPFALPAPPAPAAAAATLPAPVSQTVAMDSLEWPQQLGEQIQWRLGEGVQEARIEISPRELGTVDVRLSMNDAGLSVHLSAAHAQTRELLQNELPRLREILQQGGLMLADAQVGRESPGQSPRREALGSSQRGFKDDHTEAAQGITPLRAVVRRRGLLDDYA